MSKTKETLHDCPECGLINTTAASLAAHRKSQHCLEARPSGSRGGNDAGTPIAEERPASWRQRLPLATAKPDPMTALATAMNLAAMNPEQLAEAGRRLFAAEQRYDRMSGICGILAGLVMLEAKRRFEHGGFLEWLMQHFAKLNHGSTLEFRKSGDYRMCNYRMRAAEQFLGKLKPGACDGAEQLLLGEFAAHLADEKASPMDESNPVVAAVAAYVDGRSFRQLRDELPRLPPGGDTRPKDGSIRPRPGKGDQAQGTFRGLQEMLFRCISPGAIALLPHLPALTEEPHKVAALHFLIEFTSSLNTAARDALKIVKGRV